MKPSSSNQQIQSNLKEIIKLYQDDSLNTLFNDLVAIGTWPTPETTNMKDSKSTVAIDSVPLPEKTINLKKRIVTLIVISGDTPIKKLFNLVG